MGGRGSGGSRSSGGASENPPRLVSINDYYKDKYSKMTDKELNRAYINAQNLMKKEQTKVMYEQEKLAKMMEEFKALPAEHPDVNTKWDAIENQMTKLNDARSKSDIRSQAYLLAVNEKYNIRAKYNVNDMKSMTNGQLNSFHAKSYRESQKARNKIETAKTKATRVKYEKLFNEHNANFNKAEQERYRRGLDDKGW